MDEIVRAISGDGFASISVISSQALTERARLYHGTTPVATAALGRTLAAASMMGASMKKRGASLTVRINGGGPAGTIIAVSDEEGNARGFIQNPLVDLEKNSAGKLDVGRAVGNSGMLTVIRDLGENEPYSSASRLVSGEIAEDFTAYFAVSEQIPAACALGVLVDRDRSVISAGGYIAQLLPGASDRTAELLEKNVIGTGYVTDILRAGGADAVLESVMAGLSPRVLDRRGVEYRCACSRKRFLRAVLSLEQDEIDDMMSKGEPIEVSCQFCDASYTFRPDELRSEADVRE